VISLLQRVRKIQSVRLSVCLFVRRWYSRWYRVKTAKHVGEIDSPLDSHITSMGMYMFDCVSIVRKSHPIVRPLTLVLNLTLTVTLVLAKWTSDSRTIRLSDYWTFGLSSRHHVLYHTTWLLMALNDFELEGHLKCLSVLIQHRAVCRRIYSCWTVEQYD